MGTALVLTTVNIPNLLNGYADNFEKYGHTEEIEFIVIGDLKTPKEAASVIDKVKRRGFRAQYLDVHQQEEWMRKFPNLVELIPYNSDNRRNVGYLMAVARGAEVIISIDDDNYVIATEDYLASHKIVGCECELKTAESSNHWFNICSMLDINPDQIIYPRGFPYSKRRHGKSSFTTTRGRLVVNAGLWLGDPDIDAVTRLNGPVEAVRGSGERLMLAPGTYSPINSQNTAFHRDVLPCYYYVLMGVPLRGLTIDRYGDIWSGLFAKKVIDQIGDRVAFGPPYVMHRRNQHNLFKDLQSELWGMILTDYLSSVVESIRLTDTTYHGAYLELIEEIQPIINHSSELDREIVDYFNQLFHAMKSWVKICRKIM